MDKEEQPKIDLSGDKCEHRCEIHDEPCFVVVRYNNPILQATLERMRSVEGAPFHSEDTTHYCELCSMAMREGRELDFWVRLEDGDVVSKFSPKAK